MTALIIGISSGILTILFVTIFLKQLDKSLVYGLILSGIGFLYVGYAWANLPAFIINSIQAISFVLLAYYGVKKGATTLALGYFLHGTWDIVYHFFNDPGLIPPHYDLFCSSLDFVVGAYILIWKNEFVKEKKTSNFLS